MASALFDCKSIRARLVPVYSEYCKEMLQTLLGQRFKLVMHQDTRPSDRVVPVDELIKREKGRTKYGIDSPNQ